MLVKGALVPACYDLIFKDLSLKLFLHTANLLKRNGNVFGKMLLFYFYCKYCYSYAFLMINQLLCVSRRVISKEGLTINIFRQKS